MRLEQWLPTKMYNYSQWYVNCAHINVIGPGGATPKGFAKFPGTYTVDSPGKSSVFLWVVFKMM